MIYSAVLRTRNESGAVIRSAAYVPVVTYSCDEIDGGCNDPSEYVSHPAFSTYVKCTAFSTASMEPVSPTQRAIAELVFASKFHFVTFYCQSHSFPYIGILYCFSLVLATTE